MARGQHISHPIYPLRLHGTTLIMGSLLVLALLWKVYDLFALHGEWLFASNEWTLTEFLIDYEGGFVRRGLLGQLLLWMARMGVSPWIPVLAVSIAAYLALLVVLLRLASSARDTGAPLWWLVLSPLLMGDVWYMLGRDSLCMLVMIGMIAALRGERLTWGKVAWACVLMLMGMMLHEAFIFWGVPLVALWTWTRDKRMGWTLAVVALAMFGALSLCKGTPAMARAIHESWMPYLPADFGINPSGAVEAIGWSTGYAVKFHIGQNFLIHYDGAIAGLVMWPVSFIVIYYLVSNLIGGKSQNVLAGGMLMVSTITLLPMFTVLCCDNSRVYQFLVFSVVAMWCMVPREQLSRMVTGRYRRGIERLNGAINSCVVPSRGLLAILILCVGVAHSGFHPLEGFENSPLGSVMIALTDMLTSVAKCIGM